MKQVNRGLHQIDYMYKAIAKQILYTYYSPAGLTF
jgi:hypothetical protein